MAHTFSRAASSMSTAILSSESSLSMLVPPEALSTMEFVVSGGITVRRMPRVSINVSA